MATNLGSCLDGGFCPFLVEKRRANAFALLYFKSREKILAKRSQGAANEPMSPAYDP